MKTLTVKSLIAILQKEDPKTEVWVEGCDCEAKCVGVSEIKENSKSRLILRNENGVYSWGDGELKIRSK